jgi:hypothetical protein
MDARRDLLSSGSFLVISGRTKDRTGDNHASAFSPMEIRPKIQEQKSTFGTKGTYKICGLVGWTSLKLPSLAPTIRASV